MKDTILHKNEHTNIIISKPDITSKESRENLKHIHTTITSQYLGSRKNSKVTNTTLYYIHLLEQTLPCHMRTKLAQLKANKSPIFPSYLPTANPETYTPQCPLYLSHTHKTNHLFNCSQLPTQHNTTSPWKKKFRSSRSNPRVVIYIGFLERLRVGYSKIFLRGSSNSNNNNNKDNGK